MALRSRLAFFGVPSRREVVSSGVWGSSFERERVLERINSLIVIPAKVARVLICRCCSGSISMVSLFIPPKLTKSPILSTAGLEWWAGLSAVIGVGLSGSPILIPRLRCACRKSFGFRDAVSQSLGALSKAGPGRVRIAAFGRRLLELGGTIRLGRLGGGGRRGASLRWWRFCTSASL